MRFNYTNFREKAKMIEERDDYASVQAWALEYYKSLMHELGEIYKKDFDTSRPYTGEYHMGRVDLIREILGLPLYDWNQHPNFKLRSCE